MIPKKNLKVLVDEKIMDVEVLLSNDRLATSVYIAGYAVELALKFKICKMFSFRHGFPEDKSEFEIYLNSEKSKDKLDGVVTQIRQIRHHDLSKLLFFSGAEFRIKENVLEEWVMVSSWDPEIRYTIRDIGKDEAIRFFSSTKKIIDYILKK
jgi:HEPN domain-containing protein